MAKVKLGLGNLTPEQLVTSAKTTKTGLTGNANFTTPNPTLVAFGGRITTAETKIEAYAVLKAAAETGLAERDAALDALRSDYSLLGDYIQNASGGDRVKIESANVGVRAEGAPVAMTQVLSLALSEGDNPGSLDAMWKPVPSARSYEIQINTVDVDIEANWSFKKSISKSSDTLTGLTSGGKVWVRVRAVGGHDDAGPWSDPATKFVP
jgi:hypothetical protein